MQHQDTTNEKCMYSPQSGHSSIHGCEKLWLAGSKSRPLYKTSVIVHGIAAGRRGKSFNKFHFTWTKVATGR